MTFVTKKKLKYYGSIVITAIAIFSLSLVFISLYESATDRSNAQIKKLYRSELSAINIQYSFKKQVQEWKNILLRGYNPVDFERYHQSFIDEFEQTQHHVGTLIDLFDKENQITATAMQFQQAHTAILADYKEALHIFKETNFDSSAADDAVRGIDREPENLLNNISTFVTADIEAQQKKIENDVFFVKAKLGFVFVSLQLLLCYGLIRLTRRLLNVSLNDKVTGLGNRELFVNSIDDLASSPDDHLVAILDIDEFKIINETCGNSGGDHYLHHLAKFVKSHLPDNSVICRINGDVLGFIFVSSDQDEQILENLRSVVSNYEFYYQGLNTKMTCCIGTYDLLKNAHESSAKVLNALYASVLEAKSAGRNKIVKFHEDDAFIVGRQKLMRMVSHVSEALQYKKIVLFRQAICPLSDADTERYYEVLMRVKHDNVFHSPFPYLQAAERFHLITKVDTYILSETIDYLNTHPEDQAHYSINLSGQTLSDENLPLKVKLLFEMAKFPLTQLGFEITETDIIRNFSNALANINFLRGFGCKISLDDFGTGMSSFAYLAKLNIDTLKIDGTFIKNISGVAHNQAIVTSMVSLASSLGMKTVAEFVETKEEMETLQRIKVDYCQGYLLHKPELFSVPKQ